MADNDVVDALLDTAEHGDLIEAVVPGRVNLIGDHTDYTGGLVLPFAIDRRTVVRGRRGGELVHLWSHELSTHAVVPCDAADRSPATGWSRYVAAVVDELHEAGRPPVGFTGTVSSTIPIGGGLSSSAALEVGVALALGAFDAPGPLAPLELAQLCRRAEHRATGTPTGIMDQLVCLTAEPGCAVLIDCGMSATTVVPLPPPGVVDVVVLPSGVHHELASSAYATRVAECARAEAVIGPLRAVTPGAERELTDPVLRARVRHVCTENARVRAMVDALSCLDLRSAGALMTESHASLRDDYAVSVPEVDDLVETLTAMPGVHGARMTGGGFGGSVVVLCEPGALGHLGERARAVTAVGGAVVRRVGASGAAPAGPLR